MSLYHVAMVSLKNKIQGTFFKVKFQQPECSLNFFICQSIFHSPVGTYVNYVLRCQPSWINMLNQIIIVLAH